MEKGLVYVFTGDGKGKTSAAVGTAVRGAGAGMKVAWIAFYKQASWRLAEVEPLHKMGIKVYLMGRGFYLKNVKTMSIAGGAKVVDTASEVDHKKAAAEALMKAKELIPDVDLLVLDEVNNAVDDKLIELTRLTELIRNRGKTHLILTGRQAQPELIKLADLVTEMKKIKHPYDQGKLAVRGLDF